MTSIIEGKPVLNATLGADGEFIGSFAYIRKANFDCSLSLLAEYGDEVRNAELSVDEDDEGTPCISVALKGEDEDGTEWEEEENMISFFDVLDAETAFNLFSEFLPIHYPKVAWTFQNGFRKK